ncbi:MAG: MFS transporter [Pararobbsia sp.]
MLHSAFRRRRAYTRKFGAEREDYVRACELVVKEHRVSVVHVVAVVIGNILEFYDFLCFSIFAVYIAKAFFPAGAHNGLLLSLATFGVGFLTRPLGGLVLGSLGDRIGRKPALLISFALMGVSMLGMALTPTYAAIGVAAPVLLVVFRLIQGFALGGEAGPAIAYLIEAPRPERRGLYGSMQPMCFHIAYFPRPWPSASPW